MNPAARWLTTLGRVIGSGFGTGLSPVAPGTVGSLAAAVIYWVLPVGSTSPAFYGMIVVGFVLGIWAAGTLATPDEPDPSKAVWDEFVGLWVTCLLLPKELAWLAAAFLCFRILDVLKPWPARRLESLHGGLGIMADDLAVGLYGAVALNAIRLLFLQ